MLIPDFPPSVHTKGKADSPLSNIFGLTHNLIPHYVLVDIEAIFIDYNIALFPGNFMLTHTSLT